ncbi:MAG: hypothetical protein RMI45_08870 [Ignisphaera sp.]|nr:ATP-binding protein [Ignisphaera sp.]MDW8086329.1 hypothetical protein [Ignisphaera sp.]
MSIADHRSGRNVTVLIGESRDRDAVKIPRLLFREAFYECGRFGGVKDTPRKGSPKMGKVEVLLGRGFAALTLAAMIAYNTCSTDVGETTHHLVTLISPGSTTLTARDCMFLNTAYSRLRSFTPCILVDDVEMLRLAMLFKLYSESVVQLRMILAGSPGIESIAFQVVSVIPTGYRFYRDFTVGVQLGEVSSLDLSFKTLGFESGAEELAEKLSRLMTAAARLSSVFGGAGAVERLKHELKMIAYGVASANLKLYKESVYGALRILESNDIFWGLTDQMASELRRRADLDQRIVDEYLEREYVGKYGGDKNLALRMSEAHRLRMLMSTLAGLV